MAAYLTVDEFKLRTLLPAEVIEFLERRHVGWIATQLESKSAYMDARLRKRYDAPFSSPYPEIITDWLTRIVTLRCAIKRGVDPTDRQYDAYEKDSLAAEDELKEAADATGDAGGTLGVRGMFDLPLRADTTASGISRGFPVAYSEQSPYVGRDVQRDTGRDEDSNGYGTIT